MNPTVLYHRLLMFSACVCAELHKLCLTLQPGSCPWDSAGKNTGVGCCALLQGLCATQGSNLCLLLWQVTLYH